MPVQDELVATGGEDKQVRIWDLRAPLKAALAVGSHAPQPQGPTSALSHSARVRGIAGVPWARNGPVPGVVSAASDGVVRLWDVRSSGGGKAGCVGECGTGARLTCLAAVSLGAGVAASEGEALLSGAERGGGEHIQNGGSGQKRPKEASEGRGEAKKPKAVHDGQQGGASGEAGQNGKGEGGAKWHRKGGGKGKAKVGEGQGKANGGPPGRGMTGHVGPHDVKHDAPGNSKRPKAKKSGDFDPNSKASRGSKGAPVNKLVPEAKMKKKQKPQGPH